MFPLYFKLRTKLEFFSLKKDLNEAKQLGGGDFYGHKNKCLWTRGRALQFRNQNQGSKPRQHYILDFRIYQTTRKKRNKKQTKTNKNKEKQRKKRKKRHKVKTNWKACTDILPNSKTKQIGKHSTKSYQQNNKRKHATTSARKANMYKNKEKIQKGGVLCSGCPFPPCTNVIFSFRF